MFRLFVLGWLVVQFVPGPTAAADAKDSSAAEIKQNIVSAWQTRRERCSSERYVWNQRYTDDMKMHQDSRTDDASQDDDREGIADGMLTYAVKCTLSINGRRMRFEIAGPRPRKNGELVVQDYATAFNGEISKSLSEPIPERRYHAGSIHNESICMAVNLLATQPIRMTSAALDPAMALFDVNDLIVLDKKRTIGDASCILLEKPNPRNAGSETFWVDPAQDYSIRRYVYSFNGRTVVQLDITYTLDVDNAVWVPTHWIASRFAGDRGLMQSAVADVDEYELNPDFASDEFDIVFPPGTVASDSRPHDNVGRTGTYDYVVKDNGDERQILWSERRVPYERLLETRSGEGAISTPTNR